MKISEIKTKIENGEIVYVKGMGTVKSVTKNKMVDGL